MATPHPLVPGGLVNSQGERRIARKWSLQTDAERVVLGMHAPGAEEDRAGRNVLVVDLQVQPQPFATADGEVDAIDPVERVEVDDHLVATVLEVDAIVLFE